jgi:hypothetical protein
MWHRPIYGTPWYRFLTKAARLIFSIPGKTAISIPVMALALLLRATEY